LRAERGAAGERGHASVTTTFALALEKAREGHESAGEMLRACAFLAAEGIPEELLERFETVRRRWWFWVRRAALFKSRLDFDAAVRAATRYSLLTRNVEERTVSVHRLVQAVIQDGMNEETRREWAERAVKAVNAAFPYVEFKNWALCEGFLPHGTHLAGVIDEFGLERAEAARLLNQCGYFLKERARYGEAKPLYERSLAIREKTLGGEHPTTRTVASNLADLRAEMSPPA
jgi:hypothetical protein